MFTSCLTSFPICSETPLLLFFKLGRRAYLFLDYLHRGFAAIFAVLVLPAEMIFSWLSRVEICESGNVNLI